jgi:tRNA (guanine-N7-)-methyltransferase
MRPAQERAWRLHRHRFLLEVPRQELSTSVAPGAPLDLPDAFGREAPLIVEIGSGTGESLVTMATQRPDANVLAFEVYQPALARLIGSLVADEVSNVRAVEADAVDGLEHLLEPASIDELWLFFPDPWPKARHHKRRLVTTAFADLVAARVRSGGRWHLATDWEDYAERMRAVLDAHPAFVNEHPDWAPRWPDRPVTRFERRGLEAGRRVFDLAYRRL